MNHTQIHYFGFECFLADCTTCTNRIIWWYFTVVHQEHFQFVFELSNSDLLIRIISNMRHNDVVPATKAKYLAQPAQPNTWRSHLARYLANRSKPIANCCCRMLHGEAVEAATRLQALARAAAAAEADRAVDARRAEWERAVAALQARQKAAADEVPFASTSQPRQ